MYSLTIEVPLENTDSNRILGVNKYAKHATFKRVKTYVVIAAQKSRPPQPLKNFKLSIVRYGARALDYDNLIASFKSYIDGLRLAGIIENDSWKYIRSIETDQVVSKEKKLVITVKETSAE